MEAVAIRNLSFNYPESDYYALKNINLKIKNGEFITLFGHSGSGKSTLLKLLKPCLAPNGSMEGCIEFFGKDIYSLGFEEQSQRIGFVAQNPESQIVTDKVWHELAFGLENLGIDNSTIRRRVAETASYFGMEKYFESDISTLSGGQKQILCLASVMVMQPELLILDEPASMLDPIAASHFLSLIRRINYDLGITVIITEHRLEDVLPYSDRVVALNNGEIISFDTPQNTGKNLLYQGSFEDLPASMRIWRAVDTNTVCPVNVSQGRNWLIEYSSIHNLNELYHEEVKYYKENAVELKNLWFRYGKNENDVIKDLSLNIPKGCFYAVVGGNGAGKSTLLSLINFQNKPYSGKIWVCSHNIASLPQNPNLMLGAKTVESSLYDAFIGSDTPKNEQILLVNSAVKACKLDKLLGRHPFDLSGGEAQRTAIAKLLLLKPEILLLDEPTKGLDARLKADFAKIIKSLTDSGTTVIMVTHDIEFCAKYADRCSMLFNGEITSTGTPREFFSENSFYVTSAAGIAKGIINNAVTAEEIIYCCTGSIEKPKNYPDIQMFIPNEKPKSKEKVNYTLNKLPKRTISSAVMILLMIPLTIFVGTTYLDDQKYLFISLLVLLECMLPFFLVFEGRKPRPRELIIIAVLCAIAIAGRTLFIALPQVKPVLAIVIISGAAFGGEAGFMVGAVTMLVSNIYFGQGAWTPWQMFAAGIIGFLAGFLFKKGMLNRKVIPLSLFGFIITVIIYGGIMNFSTLILTRTPVNIGTIAAFMAQGLPLDIIHALSTLIVLLLLSKPLLDKLDRVKLKYNLI